MKRRKKQQGFVCGLILSLVIGMVPAYHHEEVLAASKGKQPELTVSYHEVALKKEKMKKRDEKNYTYSAVIKNRSKTGTIKKIQYYYQIEMKKKVTKTKIVEVTASPKPSETPVITETPAPTGTPVVIETPAPTEIPVVTETPAPTEIPVVTESPVPAGTPAVTESPVPSENPESISVFAAKKSSAAAANAGLDNDAVKTKEIKVVEWVSKKKNVVLTAKNIKPGAASERVSCMGDCSGKVTGMKLKKVKLYAGEALYTYLADSEKETITWGTTDKKAPVFSGWIGEASIYSGVTVRVCYADRKNSYTFKDHVEAVDDRDGTVSFSVDTSKINWEKDGIYKVFYTAEDKAGNKAEAWADVQVYQKGTAESVADQVLQSITNGSWSDEKKARAIYQYAKKRCSYTDEGSHTDWRVRAVNGIRYQRGDCFTFYSMARLLLTRAGIPNLEVTRYPAGEGYHHWWNLVYIKDGWYHLDTTPRRKDGKFCLVTYEQLLGYSSGRTFRHRQDILPAEATKKISPNP